MSGAARKSATGNTGTADRRASLAAAFERIVATPELHRTWIDVPGAAGILRCEEDELWALRDAGLVLQDGCFDAYDLINIGMAEGLKRTTAEREMMFFNLLLRSNGRDWVSSTRYEVTSEAVCDNGWGCAGGTWPVVPDLSAVRWGARSICEGVVRWKGEADLSGTRRTVKSPVVRRIWEEFLSSYSFQHVPESLSSDAAATMERSVGDCIALSKVLALKLQESGYLAQCASGYIFGGARASWHTWVHFIDDDGTAKDLDPAMALLSDKFFDNAYKQFCFGSFLNRILPVAQGEQARVNHSHVGESSVQSKTLTIRMRPTTTEGK